MMIKLVVIIGLSLAAASAKREPVNYEQFYCSNKMKSLKPSFDEKLSELDCNGAVAILEDDILNSCNPAFNALRSMARLRQMFFELADVCPQTYQSKKYMVCLDTVYNNTNTDSLSGFQCGSDNENYETARVCLENEYDGGCDICGFIRFMFGNVKDDLCNKKYCFNHNGLYATVAETDCARFTREDLFTEEVYEHYTYFGYMFDLDYCGWSIDGPCFN